MRFYKKNPDVEGTPFVCGKRMDDETIVCGEEFAPFADPKTFPGKPPKLVEVSIDVLNEKQKLMAKDVAIEQAERPPRHLGVVTSDSIASGIKGTGPINIVESPTDMGSGKNKKSSQAKVIPDKKKYEIKDVFTDKIPVLNTKYGETGLIDVFPGITERNVKKILSSFNNLLELTNASNADLRKAGVQPNFFDRVRKTAKDEIDLHAKI